MSAGKQPVHVTSSRVQGKNLNETIPGFDVVEISGHALEQMAIRGIDEQHVLRALRNPDETGLPTNPRRKRVRWNRTVRFAVDVVYEEIQHHLRVVTTIKVTRRISRRRTR